MSNEKEMKTCFVITPIGENGSITSIIHFK